MTALWPPTAAHPSETTLLLLSAGAGVGVAAAAGLSSAALLRLSPGDHVLSESEQHACSAGCHVPALAHTEEVHMKCCWQNSNDAAWAIPRVTGQQHKNISTCSDYTLGRLTHTPDPLVVDMRT